MDKYWGTKRIDPNSVSVKLANICKESINQGRLNTKVVSYLSQIDEEYILKVKLLKVDYGDIPNLVAILCGLGIDLSIKPNNVPKVEQRSHDG